MFFDGDNGSQRGEQQKQSTHRCHPSQGPSIRREERWSSLACCFHGSPNSHQRKNATPFLAFWLAIFLFLPSFFLTEDEQPFSHLFLFSNRSTRQPTCVELTPFIQTFFSLQKLTQSPSPSSYSALLEVPLREDFDWSHFSVKQKNLMLLPASKKSKAATSVENSLILMPPFNAIASANHPLMAMSSFFGNNFGATPAPGTSASSSGIFPPSNAEWLRNYQQQFAVCLQVSLTNPDRFHLKHLHFQSIPTSHSHPVISSPPPTPPKESIKTPKKFDFSSIASIKDEESETSELIHESDTSSPCVSSPSSPPPEENSLVKVSPLPSPVTQHNSVITSIGMNPFQLGFMPNPLMTSTPINPFRGMPFPPRNAWFMQPGLYLRIHWIPSSLPHLLFRWSTTWSSLGKSSGANQEGVCLRVL